MVLKVKKNLEDKIKELNRMKKYEKAVIVNDFHYPFEDGKTVKVFNHFIKDLKPDLVFILGDLIDFYEVSRFDKDPSRKTKLQDEIDAGVKQLQYIRKILPKAKIYLKEGNHTDRLRRYLWKHPELSSLKSLKLENLLNLDELKIKLIPYDKPFMYRGLYLAHGEKIRKYSGYTAKAELDDLSNSGITAHTHRLGAYYKTTLGKDLTFYENGCMCVLEQQYTKNPNWQQGFSVVYFETKNRNHSIQQIHIKKHKFIFNGKVYTSN